MDLTTKTKLCRLTGFSRSRVEKALAKIQPAKTDRRTDYYDLGPAIRALLASDETPAERERRLRGDLLEIKKARMEGEQIQLEACQLVWGEKLKRLADTIRGLDNLDLAAKRRLCGQLRADLDRLPAELEACRFDEAGDEEE